MVLNEFNPGNKRVYNRRELAEVRARGTRNAPTDDIVLDREAPWVAPDVNVNGPVTVSTVMSETLGKSEFLAFVAGVFKCSAPSC
jgi:hypothetical protein